MAFKMKGPMFFKDSIKNIMSSDYVKSKTNAKGGIDSDELKQKIKEEKMKNPFLQEKTSGFGPREKIKCPGDMIYHKPTGKCMTVDEYEDAMGKGKGSNNKVMKDNKNRVVINKDGKTKVVETNWQAHQFR